MSRRKQSKPKAVKEDQSEVVQAISQSKDHEDSPEPKQKRSREISYTGSNMSESQNSKEKTLEKKYDRKAENVKDESLSPIAVQSSTEITYSKTTRIIDC
ncbi:unnamed protein product [Auanema sp. JU1783]|nr:unnamed protein product [Auanema sp. JU1783]